MRTTGSRAPIDRVPVHGLRSRLLAVAAPAILSGASACGYETRYETVECRDLPSSVDPCPAASAYTPSSYSGSSSHCARYDVKVTEGPVKERTAQGARCCYVVEAKDQPLELCIGSGRPLTAAGRIRIAKLRSSLWAPLAGESDGNVSRTTFRARTPPSSGEPPPGC
jgi:hypothetical protein